LLIFIAFIFYSGLHSLLASNSAKALARLLFGMGTDRYYRIIFNIIGTLTLLPILVMPTFLPDRPLYAVPAPWSYLMQAVQAVAAILLFISVLQTGALDFLGLRQPFINPNSDDPKLVITGLYKYVRHPIYTSGILLLLFTPSMSQNSLALYISITLYLIIGGLFEERRLESQFGEDYREYKKRTPFLIPWIMPGK
jgi:protein-S-isoprenylcysteine O-methyltransferase Ste14